MSGQDNGTPSLELKIDDALNLTHESNLPHLRVLGALIAAAICVHDIDWSMVDKDLREQYLDMYADISDAFHDGLEKSVHGFLNLQSATNPEGGAA